MFTLSIFRGAPVLHAAQPFEGKHLWLPPALLCLLAIPFGWVGVFAPAIWLALAAIENARGWKKAAAFFIAAALMLTVNSGLVPGNEHITLLPPYSDAAGNLIYVSFRPAKAAIAITLVAFMLVRPQPLKRADLPVMAIAIAVPISAGLFLLGPSPKLDATIAVAALVNLLVVCIAEEGFFRWVLQRGLTQGLQKLGRQWKWLATLLVALLFTTLHTGWAASPVLLGLVGVAGLGYALVWQLRESFWACVLTHWGVNLLHMTLLQYPG
ncbi:CPBP family intramembrane glutamic endopeptidase [uncultured Microbulbifer sp.]|uniref:CPBP family intramembrane glutamic endopeptidase n=1 Tax=uncultured Microbulbifer sp. TaxID=348147 RepID=UPI0025E5ADAF|nr:CPBP family intramembrane glutamic endopeptidase [uncultured Microbulbifer sp.]